MDNKKHILLICDYDSQSAGTIIDHVMAFKEYSKHKYWILSMRGNLPERLELKRFDAVIIHYSIVISYDSYLSKHARLLIRNYQGFKGVFIQDDYRWIERTVETLQYLRINALFCLAPQEIIEDVYPSKSLPNVRRVTMLAGYVPEKLLEIKPKSYEDRKIDVGYRARKLPAWIGSHAQEKWLIAKQFLNDAPKYNMKCDISCHEKDRIYGEKWIDFIRECRAVLGTESGSSVCDFTGEIQANVEHHENKDPNVAFDTLKDLYFKDIDGKIMMNVISPRCFEAAALRTLMILYEGHYSGVLLPWRHYVPLHKDHSNMDEVVNAIRDEKRWTKIIDNAYQDVAKNKEYTYRSMVEKVDVIIDEGMCCAQERSPKMYNEESFFSALEPSKPSLSIRDLFIYVYNRTGGFIEYGVKKRMHWILKIVKNERYREYLKKIHRYVFSAHVKIGEKCSSMLMSVQFLGMMGIFRTLYALSKDDSSFVEKIIILYELGVMRNIWQMAYEKKSYDIDVEYDERVGEITIKASINGLYRKNEQCDLPLQKTVFVKDKISVIRWQMNDKWDICLHPPLPNEYIFKNLSEFIQRNQGNNFCFISATFPLIKKSIK